MAQQRRQQRMHLLLLALLLVLVAAAHAAPSPPSPSPRERERGSGSERQRSSSRGSRDRDAKANDRDAVQAAKETKVDAPQKQPKSNDSNAATTAPKKPAVATKAGAAKAAKAATPTPPTPTPPTPKPPPPELPSWARNTTAYAWTGAGSPAFGSFPEVIPGEPWAMPALLDRPALAVALGSGGARAAPLALGWARALARMGVLSQARHLSATSASAWLAAPYAYTSASDDDFFGPWLAPEGLGPTAADLPRTLSPGSWGAAVAGKGVLPIGGALGALLPGVGGGGSGAASSSSAPPGAITRWTSGVATVFLEPFGLASVAPPTAVGTLSSNSSARSAAAMKGARGGIESAADGPFLLDAIRATRDGGLLGLFGAALGGGGGGGSSSSSSSSSAAGGGKGAASGPTFDPTRGGGRPFPIVAASVVTPSSSNNNNNLLFRPFEMTPLYSGLPASVVGNSTAAADPKQLSGVLLENWGGNSRLRPSFVNATKEAALRKWAAAAEGAKQPPQQRPADLPFLSSSRAPGSGDGGDRAPVELLLQSPAAREAPPLSLAAVLGGASTDAAAGANGQQAYLASPASLAGQWVGLADGGATDATAVTAALRRRPTHLVACLAAREGPERSAADWAAAEPAVAALFGAIGGAAASPASSSSGKNATAAAPRPPPPPAPLQPSQVFARADYGAFFAAMRRAWLRPLANPADVPGFSEGLSATLRPGTLQAARTVAPVFRTRHAVLANPRAGVPGGHDVEVLWVVNARAGAWESRLPAEVRALVQGARGVLGSPTQDFPYLSQAVSSVLPAEAFVLLSQQADWQLREASDRVFEFLADARAAERARASLERSPLSEVTVAAGEGGSGGGKA